MSETPADAFYCPACGKRYPIPTDCTNQHPPTQTVAVTNSTATSDIGGDAPREDSAEQAPEQLVQVTETASSSSLAGHIESLEHARDVLDSALAGLRSL